MRRQNPSLAQLNAEITGLMAQRERLLNPSQRVEPMLALSMHVRADTLTVEIERLQALREKRLGTGGAAPPRPAPAASPPLHAPAVAVATAAPPTPRSRRRPARALSRKNR